MNETESAPNGESWIGFNARVAAALDRYCDEHAGKTIVAAVHGGIIEASTTTFLGLTPTHGRLLPLTNASITEWVTVPAGSDESTSGTLVK